MSRSIQAPEILAELMLNEQAPESSGRRLIEWAKLCGASGIVLPDGVAQAAGASLRDYARSLKLAAPMAQAARQGRRVITEPGSQTRPALARMLRHALQSHATGLPVSVGLTLNRTLGGPAHQDSLYPDEFFELASIVRAGAHGAEQPPAEAEPEIAVVIRTKNEAAWLPKTLPMVLNQTLPPKEIVIVDNDSTDETRAIAERFGIPVIPISDKEFTFGRALNRGIAETDSAWFVSLSAHCVPVDTRWLEALGRHCGDPFVAGVYGRQEPMADSTDFDKRDLWTTFGVEPRLQRGQDYFFHNANALIRREVWARIPFDESLNGVEDRDWAKKALADGYVIQYEPGASVYHKHGIHQGRNEARAKRVVKVIELIHQRQPAVSP